MNQCFYKNSSKQRHKIPIKIISKNRSSQNTSNYSRCRRKLLNRQIIMCMWVYMKLFLLLLFLLLLEAHVERTCTFSICQFSLNIYNLDILTCLPLQPAPASMYVCEYTGGDTEMSAMCNYLCIVDMTTVSVMCSHFKNFL